MYLTNNDFMLSIRVEGRNGKEATIRCNMEIYNQSLRCKLFDLSKFWQYLGVQNMTMQRQHIVIYAYVHSDLKTSAKCTKEIIMELLEVFQYDKEEIGEQNEKYLEYLTKLIEGKEND